LFNSIPGMSKNHWMANMGFAKAYDGHEMANSFFPAFNWFKANNGFMNMCSAQYQDMYKQMADLHNLWNSLGQKKSQSMQQGWSETAEKMREMVEKEWKLRADMLHTVTENCNRHMDLSVELNKKFMEELNNQFNSAFKRNEKFFSDVLKGVHTAEKEEREHEPVMVKKTAKAEPAHAHSHNHNHHKH
ncbi:MAG TPA: hypothetical protein VKG26_07655, partial [Bacteroidia bacterium]|nr:hypothetical protein [Bacteroidia bacterium]